MNDPIAPEDVISVLLADFGYYVENMTDDGVLLTDGSKYVIVEIGVEFIFLEDIRRITGHCSFSEADFDQALQSFLASDS